MKRAFVAILLLTYAVSSFSQSSISEPLGSSARRDAARLAVEKAVRALEIGDAEGALDAAGEARALDGANADACYVGALAALRMKRPLGEPEGDLREALASGTFYRYSSDDAARLLAHILVRTKRYSEALTLIDRPSLAADSDALYLRIRALRFLGNEEEFLASADSGLERFPSDVRIVREVLGYAARAPRTEALSARIRLVEGRLGYYRYLDPELLLLLVPFRFSIPERRDTLLEYRALGRKNPQASVAALELGILDDAAASFEFFSFPEISWQDLRELRGLLRDDAGRSAFSEAFGRYTGTVGYDGDGDGIYDTVTSYSQGEIRAWSLDFDQDGVPELSLKFRENVPDSGKMFLKGAEVAFEYGEYPYFSRVLFILPGTVREYIFSPDSLGFPVVALSLEGERKDGKEYSPQRTSVPMPSENALAASAYRVTERPSVTGLPVRITDVDKGLPVRSLVKTRDGRGGIVIYRNGAPEYELADMDGDGLYESRYLYDSTVFSEPSSFEADFDLDGEYEYRERLIYPYERTWDYDGNGTVDARTSSLGDGRELREFSRKFDGRLDTAIVVRDGRIERVLRAGVEVSLIPDSGGNVLWVGRKPFDFGASIPEAGYGRKGEVRYRAVRFGTQVIAEVAD